MAYTGSHYVLCALCSLKKHRNECRYNWKGQLVCSDTCWEPRHPQDFVKAVPERSYITDARPEGDPHYLEYGEITSDDL